MESLDRSLAALERSVRGPFSRDDSRAARAAYAALVACFTAAGRAPDPHDHFCALLACPTSDPAASLHVCDLARLARLEELAAAGDVPRLEAAAALARAPPGTAFDPAAHALVATDLSVLAHLSEADVGPGARLQAPGFKCAVLSWPGGSRSRAPSPAARRPPPPPPPRAASTPA